jgi:23S rRNA (adenine2503-C2)-methyltransferase
MEDIVMKTQLPIVSENIERKGCDALQPSVTELPGTSTWESIRRVEGADKDVSKYVFTKPDGVAESVLYRYNSFEDRTVICCSTQSGCPVGCRFCGAGDYFVRSFDAKEIVSQPEFLMQDQGIDASKVKKLQIMFMAMGEPLLNLKNLEPALDELHAKYPNAALLISTSGPRVDYERVRELSARIPKVGLQFSVHESTDEARDKLIPFKGKLSLQEIAAEGEAWARATGRMPFFNYCAHPGNVSSEDVARLRALFDPSVWQATISVICERTESVRAANERQKALALNFYGKLEKEGYLARMFDPAGQDDIGGGCGQLWYVQQWMKDNADQARPSIGHGKDVVHTPGLGE